MPSKSKAKGSSYERELAKFLSEKYNGSFVRVPNSGAYIVVVISIEQLT